MGREGATAWFGVPGDDIDDPVRNAGFRDKTSELEERAAACSLAFNTIAFPAASAGAILVALRNICEFHGTTAATTPIGTRRV